MLVASYDELKDANTRSPLAFPIFWVGVESLQHIKGLGSIVELAHLETSINVHVSIKTDTGLLLYVHVCVCLRGGGGEGGILIFFFTCYSFWIKKKKKDI